MRRLAAALAVLLSVPALAQREITGLVHHEPTAALDSLRGPVRSVRYRHLGMGMDDGVTVTTYDQAGRRAELLGYRGDDLRSRLVYTYDARGRNTGWELYQVPRGGGPHIASYDSPPGTPLPTVPERRVLVLNEAGRPAEEHELDASGRLRSRSVFAYDSAGRIRERADFGPGGEPGLRWVHEYDSAGRPRERRMYSRGQVFRTVYEFAEHGGLLLEEHTDGAGKLDARWAVRYDSVGRKREELVHERGQPRWRVEYRYDAAGRLSEQETHDLQPHPAPFASGYERGKVTTTYLPDGGRTVETARYGPDGSLTGRVVERLDANGRRVEREEFEPDGTRTPKRVFDRARGQTVVLEGRTRWTEEMDAHGNWVRRAYILIPDDGGAPYTLWEIVREITYW
jgi:YD repeat-containing protein